MNIPIGGFPGTPDPSVLHAIGQMATKDPDQLAKILAMKGLPVPNYIPPAPGGAPTGATSVGSLMQPQMPTPKPAVSVQDIPPPAGMTETHPGMSQPVGQTKEAQDAAGAGSGPPAGADRVSQFAQVLSQIKAPQYTPPPQAPSAGTTRGPIGQNIDPQLLSQLTNMLLTQHQQQPSLGSLIPKA